MLFKVFVCSLFVLLIQLNRKTEALDNGVALTPPMGWITYRHDGCITNCQIHPNDCLSEKFILKMADQMVSMEYKKYGYEYIIIDGCWGKGAFNAYSPELVPDPERFPNGMKYLADQIHSKGLKFGIYLNPNPDKHRMYEEYMEQNANKLAEWNVDYVKYNFFAEPDEMKKIYPKFGKLLNATGHPMVYACSWPVFYSAIDSELLKSTCSVWRHYVDIEDSYSSLRKIIDFYAERQDKLQPLAGPGHWNNPDMLLIGNYGLNLKQSKTQMAIWAILAAPLIMATDLREMRDELREVLLNKAVIAVNQDSLGIQGRRISDIDGIEIWVRPITPVINFSYSYAVAWTNTNENGLAVSIKMHLNELGLSHGDGYSVTDLFNENNEIDARRMSEKFEIEINPSETIFYKFTPISQGSNNQAYSDDDPTLIILIVFNMVLLIGLVIVCVAYLERSNLLPRSINDFKIRFRNHEEPLINEDQGEL